MLAIGVRVVHSGRLNHGHNACWCWYQHAQPPGESRTKALFQFVVAALRCSWVAVPLCVCWCKPLRGAEVATRDQYLKFALTREGDPAHGQELFKAEQRLGCTRCHTVDGSAGRAGPDLFAVGDKFGRREIIESILTPSANIAVGYSATSIELKSGDEFTGVIKQASDTEVDLMGPDAVIFKAPLAQIQDRRTSEVSLMPEGLFEGLSQQDFADLIDYLVSLRQPEHSSQAHHGMPDTIPMVHQQVRVNPIHGDALHFDHAVWAGPIPGVSNLFLVAEHDSGKIWRLVPGDPGQKTLFLDTGVHDQGARGLLELAFHPKFAQNRKYYLAKQILKKGQFSSIVVERVMAEDLVTDSGLEPRLILDVDAATNIDHAGSLVFGSDGFLYVGMGDTGPPEDPQGHGQDTKSLLAKILRIDVDHATATTPYTIPSDNPFVAKDGFRPEIWAYGLREPWRFTFDPVTGDLWVGDVGQDRYEEVDIVRRGENFGWNVYEAFEAFSNKYRRDKETYVAPVFAYKRRYGPCVTGGYVYRADPKSSLYGVYVFGDFESRRIFAMTQKDRVLTAVRQIGTAHQRIASFAQDPAGELYIVGYEGTIARLDLSGVVFE